MKYCNVHTSAAGKLEASWRRLSKGFVLIPVLYLLKISVLWAQPEVNVLGRGVYTILDGDNTPYLLDGTEMGYYYPVASPFPPFNVSPIYSSFVLENTGDATLTVSDVTFSGSGSAAFMLDPTTILPISVSPGETGSVFIQNNTSMAAGTYLATMHLTSNDPDESDYNFDVKIVVTASPEAHLFVFGDTTELIVNGDITPSLSDSTDFGDIELGSGPAYRNYEFYNFGSADLNITSQSFAPASGFSLPNGALVGTIPSSITAPVFLPIGLTVQFTPSALGPFETTFSTVSDDPNDNPYTFKLRATVVPSTSGVPEMNVQGNSTNIPDGDATPTLSDGTDLGTMTVGGSAISSTFTVQNTGTASLNVTGISLSGAGASAFTLGALTPASPIPAGGQASFTVTFPGTIAGTFNATVNITNDDSDENPYDFAITATANAPLVPEINVQGNSTNIPDGDAAPTLSDGTDLGTMTVGGSAISSTFTVQNTGTAPLDVSGIALTGAGASAFTLGALTPASPIPAGGQATFTVTFPGTIAGTFNATVNITNDDSDENPYDFAITATANAPLVPEINVQGNANTISDGDATPTLSDGTDLGTMTVGGSAISSTFTVQNAGTSSLNVTGISLSGAGASAFTLGALTPASPIPAGGQASFTVTFPGTIAGTFNATVNISNDDSDENPYDFAITATANAPLVPEINVQGNSTNIPDGDATPALSDGTDLGTMTVGGSAISSTFTVQNTGTAPLDVSGIALTGAGASAFTLGALTPASPIPAGNQATFTVTFPGLIAGTFNATVNITNDDSNENPYDFAITATANAPLVPEINVQGNSTNIPDGDASPTLSDGTDLGTMTVGGSAISSTFTVQNTGTAPLDVSGIALTGAGASAFTLGALTPASPIPVGGQASFTVTFPGLIAGTFNATVNITNDDSDENPYDFAITATANAPLVPEINVQGNANTISDGDATPTLSDGTDLGTMTVGGSAISSTFTVQNTGTAPLDVSGIALTGAGSSAFTLGALTPASPIPAGGQASFTVTFPGTIAGTFNATVNITNDDSDENPYDFAITATANAPLVPEINVQGNSTNILDGDATPVLSDGTDLGTMTVGGSGISSTFTVQNTGTAPLDVSGIALTGAGSSAFTLGALTPASPIPAGGQATFTVTFPGLVAGTFNATVNITNDDSDENPYDFAITATANAPLVPEINVQGNSTNIPDGDASPSLSDGTDLGTMTVGGSAISSTFTVQNTGTASLNVTGISLSGAGASAFTLGALTPASPIPAGGQASFTVTFPGLIAGTFNATVNITNDDSDENPYDFAITATANAPLVPEINVQGNSTNIPDGDATPALSDATDLGTMTVGGSAISSTFTVQNTGTAPLDVSGIALTGAGSSAFTIGALTPVSPIPAGGQASFTVTFPGLIAGTFNATVNITNDDSNENPYDFAITATANAPLVPEINVQGNSTNIPDGDATPALSDGTDLGTMTVGGSAISSTFTVQNTGTAPLDVSGIALTGAGASAFTLGALTPVSPIPAGGQATFTVTFPGLVAGTFNATVNITNDDSDENPYDFAITATANAPLVPEINVQGNSTNILDGDATPALSDGTDLGTMTVGGSAITSTFTVQNTGTAPLDVSGIALTGAGASAFTLGALTPASPIPAGGQASFTVTFPGTIAGTFNATVNITNDDSDENPYDFAITATANAPLVPEINVQGNSTNIPDGDASPTLSDGTDLGTMMVGGSAISSTFTVQNTGAAPLDVSGIALTGAGASAFTLGALTPASPIPAGGQASFTVTFPGTIAGTFNATVNITNDDSDENPYDFAITATANAPLVPEINVQGNSITILNGDNSPALNDGTDFGNQCVSTGSVIRQFTIQNTGNGVLNISSITATNPQFTISSAPASILANSSATFSVMFDPTLAGIQTATISIDNNDSDENPYQFLVQGQGVEPTASISGTATICPGTSTNLMFNINDGASPYAITYNNGNSNTTINNYVNGTPITVSPTSTTIYTLVNVSDGNGCLGAIVTATATVTVGDNIPPTAQCQNAVIQLNAAGTATLAPAQINNGSSDNCSNFTLSVSPNTFNCSNVALVNSVTLSVFDGFNTSTCLALVTVQDTTPPVANCQNVVIQLNGSSATISAAQVNNGSFDNCVSNPGLSVTPNTFDCSNVASPSTVILTVTAGGLTDTCHALVTVQDTTPPIASCQNIVIQLNGSSATISAAQVNNGSLDNCVSNPILSVTPNTFDCSNVASPTMVVLTVTAGTLTDTCHAFVTVQDTTPPVANCQNLVIQLNGSSATILPAQVNNGSLDNCVSNPILSVTPNTFDCSNVASPTMVVLTATAGALTDTCHALVTVQDTTPPVANCQNVVIQLNGSSATILPAQVNNGSLDNCVSNPTLSVTPNTFDCSNVASPTMVVLTVTAGSLSDTCHAFVTVQDTTPPVANCQNLVIQLNGSSATISAAQVNNGSLDNCVSNPILSVTPNTFDCSNVGSPTMVVLTVTAGSLSDTCHAFVTVQDTTSPVAQCKNASIQINASGLAILLPAQVDNNSSDNCIPNLEVTPDTFKCTQVGANTVILTVRDNAGNISTCNATVLVISNLIADAGPDLTNCLGATDLQLDASTSTGNGPLSFLWSPAPELDAPDIAQPTVTQFDAATQFVVQVTDVNGCVAHDTVLVNALTPPAIKAASNAPVCPGEDLVLTETGGDAIQWAWSDPNGPVGISDDTLNISGNAVLAGTYALVVTDLQGCTNSTQLQVTQTPGLYFEAKFLVGGVACAGDTVRFIEINNTLETVDQYIWNFGDNSNSTERDPLHVYSAPGNYIVTLIASSGGCDNLSVEKTVNVVSCKTSDEALIAARILPNITTGRFRLEVDLLEKSPLNIEVFDQMGRNRIRENYPEMQGLNKEFEITEPGFYFIHLRTVFGYKVLKLLIVKA